MSKIIPIVGSVIGATTTSCWAQTIKTDSLYGVIEVRSESEEAQIIGMQAVSKIIETHSTSIQELEVLVREILVPDILSLILFMPVGLETHVFIAGGGAVYVKREGQYAKLLDKSGSISGVAQKGDIFILLSKTCRNILPEQELFSIFDHLSADVLAEKLTLCLQGKESICGCAALLFEVKDIQSEEVNPTQSPSKLFNIREIIKTHLHNFRKLKITPGAWITIILIGIFLISVIVGIRRELIYKHDTKLQVVVQEAQRLYEEGQALLELNAAKGRERLMEAKTLLAPVAEIVTDKTKEERYASELYGRITSTLTSAMHIYTQEPQVFYDVGLLKLGGAISTMGLWGDTLVVGDTSQKAVYALTVSSKTGKIIGGGTGFEQILAVDAQGEIVYVLTPNGIHQLSIENITTKLLNIKKNGEWGRVETMIVFGGNIYLLDTANSRIWKYIATEKSLPAGGQGFSELKEYLNPDTLPDLSKATGMTIDGSVWIGTTDGKIKRFSQGKENTFIYKGVEPPFGRNLTLFTSDETKNLYVLDSQNKRVVVVDKDGIYLAQYAWTGDITPSQLVVAEKQGKILLLAAGKLYSVDLR
ncbi:MAG: hypothetical protein UT26_C0040G0006 [Microgenomates group bacterium GW2011_GWC1_39_12]|nr:MAG: hypothetical protein UT26_C0040G0006 [Microgenomates group bacterium GW2011_GWC1_39_12]